MKKILILSSTQFGYLTDTLKYCEHTVAKYDITYIGWDYGDVRIEVPGVKVQYISRQSNIIARNFRLLKAFNDEVKKGYDLVFANYKVGISFIKLLNRRQKFLLDIRTLCVNPSAFVRFVNDLCLKMEIKFFRDISVISDGVALKLRLNKYHYLPLGGDRFTSSLKKFDTLSFLYVGTLFNRNILDCVKGFHNYISTSKSSENAPTFTIVGDSSGNELSVIREYIKTNNLGKNILTTGAVPYSELNEYFEKANIGICYIPIYPYYEAQPSTKTYEYLISGLPVLATATEENKKALITGAGILIQDNVTAFKEGISTIYKNKIHFDSQYLIDSYKGFTWQRIVEAKFIPIISGLLNETKKL